MLRTLLACFNLDAMPRTAARPSRASAHSRPNRLRLHWTTRDGRLMSRWDPEPLGLVEQGAPVAAYPAA
jgi:hypothetical protein